ncbi:MAG: ATP-dependent DNA helicase, partial [Candidatus Acidiferrales bacterium]
IQAAAKDNLESLGLRGRSPHQKNRAWTELRIRRAELVQDNVTLPIQRLREAVSELVKLSEDKDIGQELVECNRRLAELRDEVKLFLEQGADEHVYWVERSGKAHKNLSLNAAPIDVADFLRRRLFESDTSIVMTSATLATNSKSQVGLNYFIKRVGAEAAEKLQVGTPFDYERQMKLFTVKKMPDPRESGYRDALVHWIEHFVTQTHGKAFVLFTNYKLMQETAGLMQPFFDRLGVACFVQGTCTPRSTMLEKFKDDTDSVLFGTDSFWQGVDVPGSQLSCVIIDKLPFAVPSDPIVAARVRALQEDGRNPFAEFQVPEAVLALKQGFGRLIRSKTDRGILAILDNRIQRMQYGRIFLESLPGYATTQDLAEVSRFMENHPE